MRTLAISLAVVFLVASVGAASDGMTIVSKFTNSDGKSGTSTSYIAEDHVRWATGDADVIVNAKTGEMITLDHKKKTYFVMTRKDIDDMAAMMKEKMNSPEMKQAQDAMKNLPPEQRKKMESMMGSMFTLDVQKEGSSRTIAGYKCENWIISIGQFSKTEECVSKDVKMPMRAWDAYKSLADAMKTMMSSMRMMGVDMEKMQAQMKKINGIPLASKTTVSVMGRTSTNTTEVTAIRNGAIPDSAWAIPAGYTKTESPMTKAMARAR